VHGVPRLPQLIGKRLHSVAQALHVVIEHYFGHRFLPVIDP
jgi:hypothetical protein